jgi:CheY-like chemotaxis protein
MGLGIFGLEFEIKDTGCGMSEEQLASLFTRYTQRNSSTSRKYGGTGLGLAISKSIIEMFGGTIRCNSKLSEGTTFVFTIFLGVKKRTSITHPVMQTLTGFILVPSELAFETIVIPLKSIIRDWKRVQSLEEDQRAGILLVDDSYLIYNASYIKTWSESTGAKVVLLRRLRRPSAKVPDFLDGAVNKPIKPSSIGTYVLEILSKPKHKETIIKEDTKMKEEPKEEISTKQEEKHPVEDGTPLNILVVEDNIVNQKIISLMLKRMGCSVTIASDGLKGIEAVKNSVADRRGPSSYDIILMDIMMPEKDGITTTEEIRDWENKRETRHRLPIIALTAGEMVEDKERCLEAGMDGYITKPVRKDQIAFYFNKFKRMKQSE